MSREEIYKQIAHHHGEIQKLYLQLGGADTLQFQSPTIREEASRQNGHYCNCNKPAKSYTGTANSGPKAGQKYVKYFCADNRCDYKKFEDA